MSIKERISPEIERFRVPIFHQPSTGCKCWGKETQGPSLLATEVVCCMHLSILSFYQRQIAPLGPTPGGTSSTDTDPLAFVCNGNKSKLWRLMR